MILALLVIASLLQAGEAGTKCLPGYNTWYDGECFRSRGYKQYSDAVAVCAADGSTFPIIRNQFENVELVALAKEVDDSGASVWIGLQCDITTRTFKWADGSELTFNGFSDGRTSCYASDHAFLDINTNEWQTTELDGMLAVCQQPPEASGGSCGDYSVFTPSDQNSASFCYDVAERGSDYDSASKTCSSSNAQIMSIHSKEENDIVYHAMASLGYNAIYLGMQESGIGKNNFTWDDGTPVDFTNFSPGFPNDIFGKCVAMQSNTASGVLINVNCASILPYVCAKPLQVAPNTTAVCPDQIIYSPGEDIYSPAYPNAGSVDCGYYLMADEGYNVELQVLDFESNACCDTLSLFDGIDATEPFATLTGSQITQKTYKTTKENIMRMQWTAKDAINVRGWHVTFKAA